MREATQSVGPKGIRAQRRGSRDDGGFGEECVCARQRRVLVILWEVIELWQPFNEAYGRVCVKKEIGERRGCGEGGEHMQEICRY